MKTTSLIFTLLLLTSSLYAEQSSYVLAFSNEKVDYINVPTLNLELKTTPQSSFEFIVAYATSLFSDTKEQDILQKNHTIRLALNYEF